MEQLDLLKHIVRALEDLKIPYAVVGSYASGAYGEVRFTQDIDIVVDVKAAQLDDLLAHFPLNDYYFSRDAAMNAIASTGQFSIIHAESGVKINLIVARQDQWGQAQLKGRKRIELLEGVEAYTARPEDIILSKMIYYREGGSEKHLRDITGMLKTSGKQIDREYVHRWSQQLDLLDVWNAVLARVDGRVK